ncbi:MAG: UDP-N-acetylmuramate:L-alanyl-gamma-D-glutamyl-meso-diaminopimelate ligase [Pseudomonadales bacterium]
MSERIYFLGIGGTLMGSLALLAKESGFDVAGSDGPIYPPMSEQLANAGITVSEGFTSSDLKPTPNKIVIGNAKLPRGDPAVEFVLNQNLDYTSGAAWLGENILRNRWVIAIAGTHGKTTTTSMVAWILEYAGLDPGFLIGGVPNNFGVSARLGESPFFVVEADEYDASYFDRRSKFVHYRPKTLVINNLEYDHADIFEDLASIQTQFHHLIRTVPSDGLIVAPQQSSAIEAVLKRGCWTPVSRFSAVKEKRTQLIDNDNGELWHASAMKSDGSRFTVALSDTALGSVEWTLLGVHNVDNALTAIAAARHAGVPADIAIEALGQFTGVKRRMELFAAKDGLRCYDDFAHHPSAIRTTLQGLRNHVGTERIVAIVEPRTHTMSLGTFRDDLYHCTSPADEVIWFRSETIQWDLNELVNESLTASSVENDVDRLVDRISEYVGENCHVVIMSNGGFGGIYEKITQRLSG